MSDIVLINSPVVDPGIDVHAQASLPLGLAYIAALLIENGFSVSVVDMNILEDTGFNDLAGVIGAQHPWMVGISAYTETYLNAVKITEVIKDIDPGIIPVMGGPHCTFLPEEVLTLTRADFVVLHEGEITMLELARYFRDGLGSLGDIKGIGYRQDGRVILTPRRPFIEDLDLLPFPARDLFTLHDYTFPGNVSTARGCNAACIFCAAGAMSGNRIRVRSAASVVSELIHLVKKYDLRFFTFIDDNFAFSKKRIIDLCDRIEEAGLDISWGCSTRVDTINKEILERMAEAGCIEIQYGVESASDKILRSIRKGVTIQQVKRAIELAQGLGIRVHCSFMLPHPEDTLETIKDTRDFMKELVRSNVTVSLALTTPFPGTYLFDNAADLGITIQSFNFNDYDACTPIIATSYLSLEEIQGLAADFAYAPL